MCEGDCVRKIQAIHPILICRATAFKGLNEEASNPTPVLLYDLLALKQFLLANLASKWFDLRSGVSCIAEMVFLIIGKMCSKINTYI